jgi:hypothetical protein
MTGFFEIGSHEQFAWSGFKMRSSWSLPPELLIIGMSHRCPAPSPYFKMGFSKIGSHKVYAGPHFKLQWFWFVSWVSRMWLMFELGASHLQIRKSTAWATPAIHSASSEMGSQTIVIKPQSYQSQFPKHTCVGLRHREESTSVLISPMNMWMISSLTLEKIFMVLYYKNWTWNKNRKPLHNIEKEGGRKGETWRNNFHHPCKPM